MRAKSRKVTRRKKAERNNSLGRYAIVSVVFGSFFLTVYGANEIADHGVERSLSSVMTEGLDFQFETARMMNISERMKFWSEFLEKNPENRDQIRQLVDKYKISDTIPLVPEKYTSKAYVETVIALARSSFRDQFYSNLVAIRYKNRKPTFDHRNHFLEVDWIPNNEKEGFVSDITRSIAEKSGLASEILRVRIDKKRWLVDQIEHGEASPRDAVAAASMWSNLAEGRVSYIEPSQLREILPQVRTGTIVNFVHRTDESHPTAISQQGILIREENQAYLRYADQGRIRSLLFVDYLGRAETNNPDAGKLIGVNLNQVNSRVLK